MKPLLLHAGLLALMAIAAPVSAAAQGLDVSRPDVQRFIADTSAARGLDQATLATLLAAAQSQPRILELIQRPAERTLAWWEYRKRFVTNERIDGGVRVWQAHREALEAAAQQSGVPPEYLVAIAGVETFYGRITGGYRVLDALATLAFDYPPRGEFFRKELGEFLAMSAEEGLDPREPRGSYAGAMGIAQFMPSSFRRYAVDGSGDGRRDLWSFGPDLFASIAHYFSEHGWRAGEPVLSDARHAASPDDPTQAGLALRYTVAALRERGYLFDTTLPDDAPAMLVPAALEEGLSWRVGYGNFYVITRYNRSLMYAMAVHELATAIAERQRTAAMVAGSP
jgi:membrane-bound lytic murein transglycosylase B